ncbi:hypothetical protein FSS13T_22480 [Flavobacterium saliperosum S13]|uniref:Uncharacterized protein n=1 Tax=Flavobacterium saliperosum S13 TaxID=1341155 RepID=A0ABN0QEZ6_9FLAO|nr:hypothetical protein FSS13T_22480 [Flavobacterium saliperosum S13]
MLFYEMVFLLMSFNQRMFVDDGNDTLRVAKKIMGVVLIKMIF